MATPSHIREVALLIQKRHESGVKLCVVVSAMGKNTNELLALAQEISPHPIRRELDMLLTCGERSSMALLAMALGELGIPSMSLTGSQSGIITDDVHSGARIIEVRPHRVQQGLDEGKVVIIAGFQGVSQSKEITTLGRGGSDTTAVAMAAALGAEACEIYSDVAGVYSADPRVITDPAHISELSYDEMLKLASSGAKVLNAEAVAFAKLKNITIKARKAGFDSHETIIKEVASTTEVSVKAITCQENLICYRFETLTELTNLLRALAAINIKPNQIIGSPAGFCLISPEDAHGQLPIIGRMADCASISLIGNHIGDNMPLLSRTLSKMQALEIPILGLVSSKLRLYFLIARPTVGEAVQAIYAENLK